MIERFERFSLAISEISRYWHKIAAIEMEQYGLKGPHVVYLTTMYRHPEGLTAARLAELCGRDKADVSRTMSLMEKKGLIVREGGSQNFYRALLKLTPEGEYAAEFVRSRASVAVELAGDQIPDEKRAIFYETLELIASNLQTISEEGLP